MKKNEITNTSVSITPRMQRYQTFKKRRKILKVVLFISVPFLFFIALYLGITLYFVDHFWFGSYINGTNYTGKTVNEVESAMAEDIHKYTLTIWQRGGDHEVIKADDIGFSYVPDGKIQELQDQQNPFLWPLSYFKEARYEMSATTTYDKEMIQKKVESLNCNQEDYVNKPVNATYEYKDGAYSIVEEIQGNQLKEGALLELVLEAVEQGKTEIDLEEYDVYKTPKITKENKHLNQLVDTMNEYIGITITYEFGDRSETLSGDQIHEWLSITKNKNGSYEIEFDEAAVREYIDQLARTYNTFGQTRNFITWDGSKVTVKGGDYGWLISRSVETSQLIDLIKEGKSVSREPVYLQKAYNRNQYDIGDTYVEINLKAQHMWYFKDGECLVDTPIVTGNISKKYGTPEGTYQITYKERNATLKGENYRTPVNYWLPFNMNIGIHDATWRDKFGGEIYKKSGSHGCVNTPYENAKIIYENIEAGVPVVCYSKTLDEEVMEELNKE